jgi:hypothetical protein
MTKRLLLAGVAVAAVLALAPAASARVIEIGSNGTPASPSCPERCEVLYRVTAYPGRIGGGLTPYRIPRNGWVVAYSVSLGNPSATQIRYFTQRPPSGQLGFGESAVRLSILRKGKTGVWRNRYRLLAQSRVIRVRSYFGSKPTFVLGRPFRVKTGWIAALTTPTWVPAFAVGLPRSNWWRSSRRRGRCGSSSSLAPPAAQQRLLSVFTWGCGYFTTRPLYTVTYIPDNRKTSTSR